MNKIAMIHAKIRSISPLHIGDGEGEILLDNDSNTAYLPATSVAGSFRAYLRAEGEDDISLFGYQEEEKGMMSTVYISDSFSPITNIEKRDGLKIDGEKGSHVNKAKIYRVYLGEGLEFDLNFEIHADEEKMPSYKKMIYKCLNALDKGHIRFGSQKSNGLGNFAIVSAEEIEFDFKNISDYERYLKRDYKSAKKIMDEIMSEKLSDSIVEFAIEGEFSTPVIIKAPDGFEVEGPDDSSLKSGGSYVIPGSSFKGALRSRVEKIGEYFGNRNIAEEMFGNLHKEKKRHRLSRVAVNEAKIKDSKEIIYNRIKIDDFTGGTRGTSLMNDMPVEGKTQFDVMYKRCGEKKIDDYAVGILALALRDLGVEDLTVGGNSSIGRGRFKAKAMTLKDGDNIVNIDFINKIIAGQEKLDEYVEAVKNCRKEDLVNGSKE